MSLERLGYILETLIYAVPAFRLHGRKNKKSWNLCKCPVWSYQGINWGKDVKTLVKLWVLSSKEVSITVKLGVEKKLWNSYCGSWLKVSHSVKLCNQESQKKEFWTLVCLFCISTFHSSTLKKVKLDSCYIYIYSAFKIILCFYGECN